MKSLLRIGTTISAIVAITAFAGEPSANSSADSRSPKATFRIDQRSRPENEGDASSSLLWQTWIIPTKGQLPYRLDLWHEGEINWPGIFHISPNRQFIFHIQKTGSGDNYGALFVRDAEGKFHLVGSPSPSPVLSDAAWQFFRSTTALDASLYHDGVEFVSWGEDGKCFEFSLHGADLGEAYWISDWRLHYNTVTGRFFCTMDQKLHNENTIHYRRK